jgi:hypothetical protein
MFKLASKLNLKNTIFQAGKKLYSSEASGIGVQNFGIIHLNCTKIFDESNFSQYKYRIFK